MSGVERLRDQMDVDDVDGRASARPSRPQSAVRASVAGSVPGSRRGSLHELVRPADDEAAAFVAAEAEAARLEAEAQQAARSVAASPVPGAVPDEEAATRSSSSKRRAAAAARPGSALRYTTTLEEDAVRDAEAAAAAEQARLEQEEQERLEEEARQLQQRMEEQGDAGAAAALQPVSRPMSVVRQASHQRQASDANESVPEPRRRASFVDESGGLPGALEEGEPLPAGESEALLPGAPASDDADLIQPVERRASFQDRRASGRGSALGGGASAQGRSSALGGRESAQGGRSSALGGRESAQGRASAQGMRESQQGRSSAQGVREPSQGRASALDRRQSMQGRASAQGVREPSQPDRPAQPSPSPELGGRQKRRHKPEDARPVPSPPPQAESSASEAESDEERPLRKKSISAHGEEVPPEEPAAVEPVVEAGPEIPPVEVEEEEEALPVFPRAARKYFPVQDAAAELERLRASKQFEEEFDDVVLPSFARVPPAGAKVAGGLQARLDELNQLRSNAQQEPVAEVPDSALLDDLLGLSRVSVDDALALEAELESERLEELSRDLARQARREQELQGFHASLARSHEFASELMRRELAEKEHQLLQSQRLLQKEEQESFRRAEDGMRSWLARRKEALLDVHMQDLLEAPKEPTGKDASKDGVEKTLKERSSDAGAGVKDEATAQAEIHDLYARVRSRRYDVRWALEPRLVRIRLDWIRCVKNKLPLGNYQMMVTLYDRLGGDALRWTGSLRSDGRNTCFSSTGATTVAQKHHGRFFNLELTFNQRENRVFLACPPQALSRPSMVFVFELFLMGDQTPVTKPAAKRASVLGTLGDMASGLAAGAAGFAGRGVALAQEMLLKARDPKQYALLKAAQANAARQALQRAPPSSDKVVAWGAFPMSYINFDIIRGQFKLPLLRGSYTDSGIEKFSTMHSLIAGNLDQWLGNLYFDVRPWPRLLDNAVEHSVELHFQGKRREGEESDDEDEEHEVIANGVVVDKDATGGAVPPSDALEPDILVLDDGSSGLLAGSAKGGAPSAPQNSQRQAAAGGSDVVVDLKGKDGKDRKKKLKLAGPSMRHDAVTSTERQMKIKLLKQTHPGLVLDLPDPEPPELRVHKRRAEVCSRYKYNVDLPNEVEEGVADSNHALGRRAAYKMRFIANELWQDLGIKRLRDWEFFFCLIFVSLWVRIYTHYLGQYLFLSSVYVPITRYVCKWYTCDITYVWDPLSVTAQTQIGVVVIGEVTNMITFGLMIFVKGLIQRVLGRTPSWTSRLLLGWGCGTVFEPLLILIIDLAQHNWFGDSFKLYQYYLAKDGNGVSGIFMTILLTLFLITASIVLFYHYILYFHMNGRILDVHYRLHGAADRFHIPHDMEISVRELRWILLKARRWTGLGGQKRKISVSKFRVRDPVRTAASVDSSIYIAIYTQSLNGEVELFRHFLRGPSGSVIEIFDQFEIAGEEAFKRIEEKLSAHEKRVAALGQLALGEFASKLANLGATGVRDSSSPFAANKSGSTLTRPRSLVKQNTPRDLLALGNAVPQGQPLSPTAGPTAAKNRFKNLARGLGTRHQSGSFTLAQVPESK